MSDPYPYHCLYCNHDAGSKDLHSCDDRVLKARIEDLIEQLADLKKNYAESLTRSAEMLTRSAEMLTRLQSKLDAANTILKEMEIYLSKGSSQTAIYQGSIFHREIREYFGATQEKEDE